MARDVNVVCLSGRLTRDPDLRATAGGTSVLSFRLAVGDRRRAQDGQWEDEADYVDCALYGQRADSLSTMLVKGTQVSVSGRLKLREWRAQDGSMRSRHEVVVDCLTLPPRGRQGTQVAAQAPEPPADPYGDPYGEEIPF